MKTLNNHHFSFALLGPVAVHSKGEEDKEFWLFLLYRYRYGRLRGRAYLHQKGWVISIISNRSKTAIQLFTQNELEVIDWDSLKFAPARLSQRRKAHSVPAGPIAIQIIKLKNGFYGFEEVRFLVRTWAPLDALSANPELLRGLTLKYYQRLTQSSPIENSIFHLWELDQVSSRVATISFGKEIGEFVKKVR